MPTRVYAIGVEPTGASPRMCVPAAGQNAANFSNSQSAFGQTQNDIGDYKSQLAKFVSSNPYSQGGEYDQTINTGLSNVSDAGANSLAGALGNQAKRTGQLRQGAKVLLGAFGAGVSWGATVIEWGGTVSVGV